MEKPKKVKVLKFYPDKCDGGLACEQACSKVHFKSDEGGDKSAIRNITYWYRVQIIDKRGRLSKPSQPVNYHYS